MESVFNEEEKKRKGTGKNLVDEKSLDPGLKREISTDRVDRNKND